MSIIKIGADPEGFIVDGNGEFVSAEGIIPGTKQKPFALEKGAVQVDGLACEFNIDPTEDAETFAQNCSIVITQIEEILHLTDKELSLKWTPVAKFRPIVWEKVPEFNKILGCDPDFNVAGEVNESPAEKLLNNPIRTAAGHIHIGFTNVEDALDYNHFQDCLYFAQGFHQGQLNTFIPHTSEEQERLIYYGNGGSFRPKKYGVELRAPSNLWVKTEASRKLIFNEVRYKFRELSGV